MDFEKLKIEIKEIAAIASKVPEQFREKTDETIDAAGQARKSKKPTSV